MLSFFGKECSPNNSTAGQIERFVKKYLKDNPAKLHKEAAILVINAITQAFPYKR